MVCAVQQVAVVDLAVVQFVEFDGQVTASLPDGSVLACAPGSGRAGAAAALDAAAGGRLSWAGVELPVGFLNPHTLQVSVGDAATGSVFQLDAVPVFPASATVATVESDTLSVAGVSGRRFEADDRAVAAAVELHQVG